MSFNSTAFMIFLPIVFLLYWFVLYRNIKLQNILLLFASYFFYGWWNWRFLFLLFSISIINYLIGIRIDKNETDRKRNFWFIAGLFLNIGTLCIFKYFNFFVDSFIDLAALFGYDLQGASVRIIIPLGISFYTFISLSYLIDIYKKNLRANKNVGEVLLALGFFPIILAGPIQRPSSLLPQIAGRRVFEFEKAVDGLRQILWGLFAKVVVADSLAPFVDEIFRNYSEYSGITLIFGTLFFTVQIYADFSGYSNIAIGTGKLLGFNLMRNFAYPYLARDISEFWKRWHISLTTWFRDYVFLPVSFAVSWKTSKERIFIIRTELYIYIVASIITWFLTGLWHGANYTYIIWGMIHGFFLILFYWQRKPRLKFFKKIGISNNNFFVIIIETILTLMIVTTAWIYFRSESVNQANEMLYKILIQAQGRKISIGNTELLGYITAFLSYIILNIYFLYEEKRNYVSGKIIPFLISLILLVFITIFGRFSVQSFIYFQF